ncbi:ATP-dependent DNA helicase RecG [Limihaloglobus sulfuriphilus]|uniref:ATP-dependent DNA helicase RecG n=1 Tax=Limihaloglobus sulfuriphilus TaxID=1851148 RepID=A0A1Q2MHM3_9BACT|nr:ATP-dependent DNA helicase RecG [Limihaloglobus sulfuriphilus]AQQ72191.1 ATP-dependent DNA helicase RecG [Limihaloglobus sulfuriphilus]
MKMDSQYQKNSNFLKTGVTVLKGVSPYRQRLLAKLGVLTAGDLLEYFPRSWEFLPEPAYISELRKGMDASVVGIIESIDFKQFRRPPFVEVYLVDNSGNFRLVWFNGGYILNQIDIGMPLLAYGKVSSYKHQLQMTNPRFRVLEEGEYADVKSLGGSVYPATKGLTTGQIKYLIRNSLETLCQHVPEFFTDQYRQKTQLLSRKTAFHQIHQPLEQQEADQALRTLKYEELFLMQLGLALRRNRVAKSNPISVMGWDKKLDTHIRRRFPFMLTEDQDAVIDEIVADMLSRHPMNRLLQGDVGSGKTVVAVYAALMAVANKSQAVIMAPTEILAQQHYDNICRYLEGSRVNIKLVTGSITGKKRQKIHEQIKDGEIDIVVGTVALLNDEIEYRRLGLVVIDEQHKFGVDQRARVRKGALPHTLVMTATPIPRTITMTAFGDLDVSVIKHSPPGRGRVKTRVVEQGKRDEAIEFIHARIKAGKQAFFVYPRITSSEDETEVKAALYEHKRLSIKDFPEFEVGLLHGRMSAAEKSEIMESFRSGKINILVSTVVIEVGVDVPNATIMVIETADRFGLAQLHQLRGRIGRGQSDSYCFLFGDLENEIAAKRLAMMEKSHNGFEIAEFDLSIRGPGEMFSTRQHGMPDLKLANIVEDFDLLCMARRDAAQFVKDDPLLEKPENVNLREAIIDKYGEKLGLIGIG